jgi:chromate reductase
MTKIAVLVGSLRKDSFSRKVAEAITRLETNLSFDFVDIGTISYFNEDLEANPPVDWTDYRNRIAAADAVLFVTPEYVRSVPAVLKNAIDVGSRPYGQGVLIGKPAAVVSTSLGAIGGFGANHHLRQSLASLDMPTLGQPECYIGNTGRLFNSDDELVNEGTREFLVTFAKAFKEFVKKMAPPKSEIHLVERTVA